MDAQASTKACFVLMPFSVREVDRDRYPDQDHWTEVYHGLIRPAVERAGLVCVREDEDRKTRIVVRSILQRIEDADLILCDLSGHNPNVFLELGWALCRDKPYVLIKDELTAYTFDLQHVHIFEYASALQPLGLQIAQEKIAEAIATTLDDEAKQYSLIKALSLDLAIMQAADTDPVLSAISEVRDALRESLLSPAVPERLYERPSSEQTLRGADFSGQDVTGRDFSGQDLRGAIFFRANAAGANFQSAILDGVDFEQADLRGTDLRAARMRGAKLRDAQLGGALLQVTNLRRSTGLTAGQLDTAIVDEKTTLLPELEEPPPW